MTRYKAREEADSDYWDRPPVITGLSVVESGEIFTGLLNEKGHRIYRVNPPVGFGRDEEW